MAHFQIYVPTSMPPEMAAAAVGPLFRRGDQEPTAVPINPGPGGGRGVVLTWAETDDSGYRPERQTWTRCEAVSGAAESEYWIGFDKLSSPTPANLARAPAARMKGLPARLLDGNDWIVPNSALLQHRFRLGDDGRAARVPAPEAEGVLQLSKWAQDALERSIIDRKLIPLAEGLSVAVSLLRINYRVNIDICRILGLFDPPTIRLALLQSTNARAITLVIDLFDGATDRATAAPN
jgi:hypothetical protein